MGGGSRAASVASLANGRWPGEPGSSYLVFERAEPSAPRLAPPDRRARPRPGRVRTQITARRVDRGQKDRHAPLETAKGLSTVACSRFGPYLRIFAKILLLFFQCEGRYGKSEDYRAGGPKNLELLVHLHAIRQEWQGGSAGSTPLRHARRRRCSRRSSSTSRSTDLGTSQTHHNLNRPPDAAPGDSRHKHAAGVIFRTPHTTSDIRRVPAGAAGSLVLGASRRVS